MKPRTSVRLRAEQLEDRAVPAAYVVATNGSDANPGTSAAPWRTLQHAADAVRAGDSVTVRAGDYAGFDLRTDGTSSAPIVFRGESGARVVSRNPVTTDGINLEGASWITIEGFTVINQPRAGIRSVLNDHVTIRNNVTDNNFRWGIFTAFSDDALIEGNSCSRSQDEHGIYFSNSADRPIIRNNTIWGNREAGIHINGDESQGGDGIISNALVENNVIYDNGLGGASGINCDGVQNSTIRNNLIYNSHASGISLYRIDGGGGSTGNLVINNTVLVSSSGRWALNIQDGSTGNTARNNVLFSAHSSRGAIDISSDSLSGFVSNHNVVEGLFTTSGGTALTLAQWRSQTGQDANSVATTDPSTLFVNAAGGDYHLRSGSAAIDRGTTSNAPPTDSEGTPRPSGAGVDIGHDELATSPPPPPPPGNTPPTVSDVANQTVQANSNSGPLAFTVSDTETAAGSLQVTATSSNLTLIPAGGLVLGGSGGSRTITVTPTAGRTGTATITLTVTDAGGLTDTDTFVITVPNTPPTITDVPNQTIPRDSSTGALSFTISDAQTAAGSLQLTASSSNTTLVPASGLVLSGSGGSRTITVTPAAGQTGTATITLTVTDLGGLTATDTFVLTVTSPPPPPPPPGNTPPTVSDVTDKSVQSGQSTPAISFTIGDAETPAGSLVVTASSSNTTLLPQSGITLGGSGANRTVTLTPAAGQTGSVTVTLVVTDAGGLTDTDTFVLTVTSPPPPPPPPGGGLPFAVGTGSGATTVTMYNPDGTVRFAAQPFGSSYTGGAQLAVGDVTGDGVPDVVAGTNGNALAQVRIVDGATGAVRPEQLFANTWYYGKVAVAVGDLTGDGVADIAVGSSEAGPRAQVFQGGNFAKLADFAAGPTASFWGRTQVALGDTNADGRADLVVSALYPNGTRFYGFNGTSLRPGATRVQLFNSFALGGGFSGGAFLAVGDVNADGYGDLVLGSGEYGNGKVVAYSGQSLVQSNTRVKLAEFAPEGANATTGVRVVVRDVTGDGVADIVAASGTRATVFRGGNLPPVGTRLPVFLRVDTSAGGHVG